MSGPIHEHLPVEAARRAAAPDPGSPGGWSRAMRMTPLRGSKPSISASSWFRVCSRSSWPPSGRAPAPCPSASSSSMKMMQGALGPGLLEEVADPGRAHADEHLHELRAGDAEKNGTPASPATARASSVLPGPGRPDQQDALRDPAAEPAELLRGLQEVDDLLQLLLGLVDAGHVREGGLDPGLHVDARAAASRGEEPLCAASAPPQQRPAQHRRDEERHHPHEGAPPGARSTTPETFTPASIRVRSRSRSSTRTVAKGTGSAAEARRRRPRISVGDTAASTTRCSTTAALKSVYGAGRPGPARPAARTRRTPPSRGGRGTRPTGEATPASRHGNPQAMLRPEGS